MADKDREAFEAALEKYKAHGRELENEFHESLVARDFWELARDRYAPKLTEKEAVSVIAPMVCREGAKWDWHLTSDRFKKRWFDVLKEALRAAGIRFAEEA